jgi:spermidine/putrescine-binding protein
VLFIDSLVIPSSAKRPDLAHRFINYLMQPEVAALVTAETLYSQRQVDSREFRRNLRNQPDLYPDQTPNAGCTRWKPCRKTQRLSMDMDAPSDGS